MAWDAAAAGVQPSAGATAQANPRSPSKHPLLATQEPLSLCHSPLLIPVSSPSSRASRLAISTASLLLTFNTSSNRDTSRTCGGWWQQQQQQQGDALGSGQPTCLPHLIQQRHAKDLGGCGRRKIEGRGQQERQRHRMEYRHGASRCLIPFPDTPRWCDRHTASIHGNGDSSCVVPYRCHVR